MRDVNDVEPAPKTELEILRHGIAEIAALAPGSHQLHPDLYAARREIKDYAVGIKKAAEEASTISNYCPHCGERAPSGAERPYWLAYHIESRRHAWWWGLKTWTYERFHRF